MQQRTKAICYMLCSALSFTFMNVFIRLSGEIPSLQKCFFRNLISLMVALFLVRKEHTRIFVPKGQKRHLFIRCFLGTLGVICNFYAVDHMMLSDASMLNKMSPFFAVMFSGWILKEKATKTQWLFSLTALAGCIFVLKPTIQGLISPAALVALLGGLCAGIAYTEVRVLGVNHVNKTVIILVFSAFSCLSTLPVILFDYTPMTGVQLLLLLLAGVAATGGQFGITAAYCYAPAAEVSVYDYSQIIFSAILGYLFFQQMADGLSFVGYFIICGSAVLMTRYHIGKKE